MPTPEVEKQVATKKESSKRDKMHWKDNFVLYLYLHPFFAVKYRRFWTSRILLVWWKVLRRDKDWEMLSCRISRPVMLCSTCVVSILFKENGALTRGCVDFKYCLDVLHFNFSKTVDHLKLAKPFWEALKFCLKLWKTKENLKIWFFFWTEFSAGISSDRFKIRAKKYKLYRAIIKLVMLVFLLGRASDLLTDWCCEKSGTFPKSFGAVQTNYRFVTICILHQILCLLVLKVYCLRQNRLQKPFLGGLRTHLTAILTTQKLY